MLKVLSLPELSSVQFVSLMECLILLMVTIPWNSIENFTIPVPSGEYRMIAFDLESNHLPNMPVSMVALSQDIIMTVNSGGEGTCSVCYCCAIIIVIYCRCYQSTTQ